jgi:hypothetical protein
LHGHFKQQSNSNLNWCSHCQQEKNWCRYKCKKIALEFHEKLNLKHFSANIWFFRVSLSSGRSNLVGFWQILVSNYLWIGNQVFFILKNVHLYQLHFVFLFGDTSAVRRFTFPIADHLIYYPGQSQICRLISVENVLSTFPTSENRRVEFLTEIFVEFREFSVDFMGLIDRYEIESITKNNLFPQIIDTFDNRKPKKSIILLFD